MIKYKVLLKTLKTELNLSGKTSGMVFQYRGCSNFLSSLQLDREGRGSCLLCSLKSFKVQHGGTALVQDDVFYTSLQQDIPHGSGNLFAVEYCSSYEKFLCCRVLNFCKFVIHTAVFFQKGKTVGHFENRGLYLKATG